MRIFFVPVISLLCLILVGCSTTKTPSYYHSLTGDPIQDGYIRIEQGDPEDKILWQYSTALELLRLGRIDEAAELLDEALLSQEALAIDGGKKARQAQRVFYPESTKVYIGEPYERAMAWFYRGIIYWIQGEPDNARACFKSAQLMDSSSEGEKFKADYVILDYLIGMINKQLSGSDDEFFRFAEENSKLDYFPKPIDSPNIIFVLEFGKAPIKYRGGEYGQLLKIRKGSSKSESSLLQINEEEKILIGPMDDLAFQAQTRGGRYMDHVLGRKAVFKQTTDTLGDAAIIGGAIMAAESDHTNTGLAIAAVGVLSKIISAASNPEADTRTWKNLPQFLSLYTAKLTPGNYEAVVQFLDENGQVIGAYTKTIDIHLTSNKKPLIVFISQYSK